MRTEQEQLETGGLQTPLGWLAITASHVGIVALQFREQPEKAGTSGKPLILQCIQQLESYFDGRRKEFSVPLDMRGSDFQVAVWKILCEIPYGTTLSYRDVARKMGDENAVRAVGSANGKNPLAVIVPCHRVIGSDGNLTGYAGGIQRKEWLLKHEGAILSLL